MIDRVESIPHLRNLFETYFDKAIPEIQLVYHVYGYEKNGAFKEDKVQVNVDPNDQIYYMFKGVTIDEADNDFFNSLEVDGRIPFKNGIYLNVKGTSAYGDDSVWMAANTSVQTLMTDIQSIVYSQYSIDDSDIVPYDEAPSGREQRITALVDTALNFITSNSVTKSL